MQIHHLAEKPSSQSQSDHTGAEESLHQLWSDNQTQSDPLAIREDQLRDDTVNNKSKISVFLIQH